MDTAAHWESVYRLKRPEEVSWFQREPSVSIRLIRHAAPHPTAAILDVGGGASRLVDHLLLAGYSDVSVLDVSATALAEARTRLGKAASRVRWLKADMLNVSLAPRSVDVWHDRAVFHFLTEASQRAAYVEQVRRAVRPGGHVIVATFAEDGPQTCSGLSVDRYSPETLHAEFDDGFELVDAVREQHITPAGVTQSFVYCLCRHVTANLYRKLPDLIGSPAASSPKLARGRSATGSGS
jgi:SAM-dependent methyltransferase